MNRMNLYVRNWLSSVWDLMEIVMSAFKSRVSLRRTQVTLFVILFCCVPVALQAAPLSLPAMTVQPGANGEQTYSVNLQILIFMTLLTVLPGMLMAMTAFT